MRKNQLGLGVLGILVLLIVFSVLIIIGGYTWQRKHISRTMTAKAKNLLVELKDSGSTNTTGWDLLIYSDGSGKVGSKALHASTFNVEKLREDLDNTKLDDRYDCTRSASFGSVETLIYKNISIIGIDCYFDANPDTPLSKGISSALQTAGID